MIPGLQFLHRPAVNRVAGLSVNNVPDIPLGRFGTTEEVADAIMFLVANEYANNTVLNLDGGLSAK